MPRMGKAKGAGGGQVIYDYENLVREEGEGGGRTSTFTRLSCDADNTREFLADTAKLRLAGDAE